MAKKKKKTKTKDIEIPPPRGGFEGKHVVVFLALLGLIAGLLSWGYYVQLQRRPMEFWGADKAKLLMQANQVLALKLVPSDQLPPGKEALRIYSFGGKRWAELEFRDISHAGGLGIMRQTLLNDNTYAWSEKADECQPVWQYALQFTDVTMQQETMLFLSLDCPRAMIYDKQEAVSIRPAAEAMKKFMEDQFKNDEPLKRPEVKDEKKKEEVQSEK